MLLRLTVFVCISCILINESKGDDISDQAITPYSELPCIVIGGQCTAAGKNCPAGTRVTTKGLCPLQELKGVECCRTVWKVSDTCGSRGGDCVDGDFNCPEFLTYKKANDCKPNQKCCIFVN